MTKSSPPLGIDTPVLLAHSLREHSQHESTRTLIQKFASEGHSFAICPIVIDEFLHVATDPKRFESPLEMKTAAGIAEAWMQARESRLVLPSEDSCRLQHIWLREYRLGRKRIHDTAIAAIYHCHGIQQILTSNFRDFRVFGVFETIDINEH